MEVFQVLQIWDLGGFLSLVFYFVSLTVCTCHETTAHGLTQLESTVVPGIECETVRLSWQDCNWPVCNVHVALSRLLLFVYLCPKLGTSNRGNKSSDEEL